MLLIGLEGEGAGIGSARGLALGALAERITVFELLGLLLGKSEVRATFFESVGFFELLLALGKSEESESLRLEYREGERNNKSN